VADIDWRPRAVIARALYDELALGSGAAASGKPNREGGSLAAVPPDAGMR
jgi:hypothetical protein